MLRARAVSIGIVAPGAAATEARIGFSRRAQGRERSPAFFVSGEVAKLDAGHYYP
ncbi:hypothetical protein [Burkholderia oklahomensis]|uniref:hypothetical protein n=1 Tax=Burkholderia oklahomensis TaxID=342113 RepID=UPI00016A5E9E|nr:hypothetical protein [Burkholderia oklahomensis]MDN7673791.1 hypothetical protein [Burkholderia oklahomensis]QPS38445.1 hypothetical protein I6G57_06365 [Burkholderia oklahomensis]